MTEERGRTTDSSRLRRQSHHAASIGPGSRSPISLVASLNSCAHPISSGCNGASASASVGGGDGGDGQDQVGGRPVVRVRVMLIDQRVDRLDVGAPGKADENVAIPECSTMLHPMERRSSSLPSKNSAIGTICGAGSAARRATVDCVSPCPWCASPPAKLSSVAPRRQTLAPVAVPLFPSEHRGTGTRSPSRPHPVPEASAFAPASMGRRYRRSGPCRRRASCPVPGPTR